MGGRAFWLLLYAGRCMEIVCLLNVDPEGKYLGNGIIQAERINYKCVFGLYIWLRTSLVNCPSSKSNSIKKSRIIIQ